MIVAMTKTSFLILRKQYPDNSAQEKYVQKVQCPFDYCVQIQCLIISWHQIVSVWPIEQVYSVDNASLT